jgi:hypothetical protein
MGGLRQKFRSGEQKCIFCAQCMKKHIRTSLGHEDADRVVRSKPPPPALIIKFKGKED